MANICTNWIEIFGKAETLQKIIKHDQEFNFEFRDDILISNYESRWSPPVEELQAISYRYNVVVECEYDERGSDIWGKIGYENGEKIFDIEMTYLKGKYHSMEWNDFVECEVIWKLNDPDPFEDFMEEFEFCSDEHKLELEELFFENAEA